MRFVILEEYLLCSVQHSTTSILASRAFKCRLGQTEGRKPRCQDYREMDTRAIFITNVGLVEKDDGSIEEVCFEDQSVAAMPEFHEANERVGLEICFWPT